LNSGNGSFHINILQTQVSNIDVSLITNERCLQLSQLHRVVISTTNLCSEESMQIGCSTDAIVVVRIEDGSTQILWQSLNEETVEPLIIGVPFGDFISGSFDVTGVGDN
jgi:hypothetical protein